METIAKTIGQRQLQIEQLSIQLLDSLNKVSELEKNLEELKSESQGLIKKLEKKSLVIKQESDDIELLKKKILSYGKRTWGDTFSGIKSWIGYLPNKLRRKSKKK